jgi:hypothetical protein
VDYRQKNTGDCERGRRVDEIDGSCLAPPRATSRFVMPGLSTERLLSGKLCALYIAVYASL